MNASKRRNRNKSAAFLLLLLFFGLNVFPQTSSEEISILFYNTENLFDTYNSPNTSDEEFTPQGARHWTPKRLNAKLQNLSKVILASAGWKPPVVVGFCEIENRLVLERLLSQTPLKTIPYGIIHKESPDPRGIEVALLYNRELFNPVEYKYIPILLENDSILKSREILHVSGIVGSNDTLHIFINHWPSRYSGLLETRSVRNTAGLLLKKLTDEVLLKNSLAKIVIMGDFNDQPGDESLRVDLQALEVTQNPEPANLYNLSDVWQKKGNGTLKFQSQWSVFDQIIVSGNLLNCDKGLCTSPDGASIMKLPFLLERDEQFGGQKLKRTYIGFAYNGGFSDHLPVLLKLSVKK